MASSSFQPKLTGIAGTTTITGLSTSTIKRMIQRGQFPAPRFNNGGRRMWLIADIDKWIAENTVGTPATGAKR